MAKSVSLTEIALDTLHRNEQEQIMGIGSYVSPSSPPPFGAQFAEVTVDTETGQVTVDRLVMAVDSGVIVNPLTAGGQIEGGMTQALGYAVCEEMRYDEKGIALERDFDRYHLFRADEMPELTTIFVETFEPSHPFGVKAVAEIPMDGVAPAVGNAVLDAVGVDIDENPITPEKVWRAIKQKDKAGYNLLMDNFSNWLQTYLGINLAAQQKLLISVLIVLALWLFQRILRSSFIDRIQNVDRRYQWQKALRYIFTTWACLPSAWCGSRECSTQPHIWDWCLQGSQLR